jgi:hypothetical protein
MPAEARRFPWKNGSACGRINFTSSAATNQGPKWMIGSRPRRNYRPRRKNIGNGTEDRLKRTQLLWAAGWLCCAAAFAQSGKPDFSGTWKLNNGKSTQDGPADRVYLNTIKQSKNEITVATKSEGVTNLLDATFPITEKFHIGKEGNNYRYTRAYWEGATLVFEVKDQDSKKDTAKVVFYVRESWTLSPNGNVLTKFRRTLEAAKTAGERPKITDQKYVFDKQ